MTFINSNKMKIIFVLAISGLFLNCNYSNSSGVKDKITKSDDKKESTIVLNFKAAQNSFIGFNYFDEFENFKQIVANPSERATSITKNINSKESLTLYYAVAPKIIPVLIFPGDSVDFNIVGTKLDIKSNRRSHFDLNFFRFLSDSLPSIFDYEIIRNRDKNPDRNILLENCYTNSVKFLENSKLKLPDSIYHIYKAMIEYRYLQYKLVRLSFDKNQNEIQFENLKKKINNEKHTNLKEFKLFVEEFCSILVGRNLKESDYFKRMYDSTLVLFKGPIKNHMLFTTIIGIRNKAPVILLDYLKRFEKDCTNETYKNYVKTNFIITQPSKKAILKSLSTSKTFKFEEIIKNNKNKPIYIDFWASWCLPCREEMKFSKELKQIYSNKVAFIYISINNNITEWKEASQDEKLYADINNFLLLNPNSSSLNRQFNLSSIPRYVIYNRNGKLIDDDAPRPSDPKIKIILDDLIK